MKRIVLFVLTNVAVMVVMSVVLSVLGLDRYLHAQGLNLGGLLAFSLVVGFTGSIFSLLISKPMAKWSTGAQVIEQPANSTELWLVDTVRRLATQPGTSKALPSRRIDRAEPGVPRPQSLPRVPVGDLPAAVQDPAEVRVLGDQMAALSQELRLTLEAAGQREKVLATASHHRDAVARCASKRSAPKPCRARWFSRITARSLSCRRKMF